MKRATITIPDDLEAELDRYLAEQDPSPSLTAIFQSALRHFLTEQRLATREYRAPTGPLRITPAEVEGEEGPTDVSIHHDKYLVEALEAKLERSRSGEP